MSREDFFGSEFGLDRLDRGIQVMSKAVRALLALNNLTHTEMVRLSQWCNPWGMTWFSASQISYLRTGNLVKVGPRTIDALGQINLRLAQAAGYSCPQVDDLPDFEPIPASIALPSEPFYLRHPQSRDPLDAGGLYMCWLGRLVPEGLEDEAISDREARRLSENISRIFQAWARDHYLTISEAIDRLLKAYPIEDQDRVLRLRMVALGLDVFSGEALVEELPALGEVLGVIVDEAEPIEAQGVRKRLYQLPKADSSAP